MSNKSAQGHSVSKNRFGQDHEGPGLVEFCASKARTAVIAGLLAIGLTGQAQAGLINLTLSDFPDIMSSFIGVTYTEATDVLSAEGFAIQLNDDGIGSSEAIVGGSFSLLASIGDAGDLTGGSLTIGGTVASLGFNSGTLLTGSLTAFGFSDAGGDPFEFLFDVTGGDAAGLYGGMGGVILSGTDFTGTFNADFDNLSSGFGTGVADVGTSIPEPGSLALVLTGGVFSLAARRRAKRNFRI